MHELMVLDPRHTFPDNYACFAPTHFLLSRGFLAPLIRWSVPKRRPVDNMALSWDRPQEDEFALCNLGAHSPYLTMAFPNSPPQDQEYLTLDKVPPAALARWKQTFLNYLKSLTAQNPAKRIILKSPPHTGRIRVLLDLFPQAKFVHIVRDPYVVFPSTMNLWKRLYKDEGFQTPRYKGLEDHVFDTLVRMYDAFERDRELIPAGQLCEIRYEDLVANPVGQLQRIYGELELGGFEDVRVAIAEHMVGQSGYKRNRHQIAPEVRDEISRRWSGYIAKYGYEAVSQKSVGQAS